MKKIKQTIQNTIYMSTLIHTNILLPEFAVFDNQDLATKMLQES